MDIKTIKVVDGTERYAIIFENPRIDPAEFRNWAEENIGRDGEDWIMHSMPTELTMYVREFESAIAIQMRWAGQ